LAVVALAITLDGVSVADARSRTTRYYTISVVPPTPSSSALVLGSGPGYNPRGAVRLTSSAPGRLDQHWSPAPNPEWPGFPRVSGGWDPFGFEHGRLGVWEKFVNRASGLCLTLGSSANGTAAVQGRCAREGSGIARQIWSVSSLSPVPDTRFAQGKAKTQCLDVTGMRYAADTPLQGWRCQPSNPWNQRFRLAPVAAVTCEIGVTNRICGLSRPPP
jgi:hypothetical protein